MTGRITKEVLDRWLANGKITVQAYDWAISCMTKKVEGVAEGTPLVISVERPSSSGQPGKASHGSAPRVPGRSGDRGDGVSAERPPSTPTQDEFEDVKVPF